MYTKFLSLLCALVLLFGCAISARAVETDENGVCCFSAEDFSPEGDLTGICVTGIRGQGQLLLGSRVILPGDILTAGQLSQLTYRCTPSEWDTTAEVTYLPVFSDHVSPSATAAISIRGRENDPPVAEDFAGETYKNLPLEGKLKVTDPEGGAMTYTVTRQPRRGDVTIREDGSFTYTPKKNKVGIDSFVFTATDEAGKVSREATVTVTIVKPADATLYTDTLGRECRFAAEWMKNTGIFVGEKLDGNACFGPEEAVSRGEFLTMLVRTLELPTDARAVIYEGELPLWLQPYVAAAVRAGLTDGLPAREAFAPDEAITGAEAAVMLQNALELEPGEEIPVLSPGEIPEWAQGPVNILASHGIRLEETLLTRESAALALLTASRLAPDAPGTRVLP